MSQLPRDTSVVPLAFHVDYWDKLGWRDPFGQAAFSQRQRARNGRLGWVYTPQAMLDGEDFRTWHRGLPARQPAIAQAGLTLALDQTPERIEIKLDSRFASPAAERGAALYLALYENRLISKVTAGENAERTLRHDYVVRSLVGPLDPRRARHRFEVERGWKTAGLGVAAFVLDARGDTLQALARTASVLEPLRRPSIRHEPVKPDPCAIKKPSHDKGGDIMVKIVVEAAPDAARLASLGVDHWPVWEKGNSEFPWEYFEPETSYILEGRAIITPEGGAPVEIAQGNLVTLPSELICKWKIVEPIRKRYRIG